MKIIKQYQSEKDQDHLEIMDANYNGDFAIRLTFNDGQKLLVDFKHFLEKLTHPAIKKYLNEELFKNFQIKDGNLDWNEYDLCFPIENLYKDRLNKRGENIKKY